MQEVKVNKWIVVATAFLVVGFLSSRAQAQSPSRLLASNCFQCHGTNGKPGPGGFDSLAGKSAPELYGELLEMRRPPDQVEREKEIMAVHANGFTLSELRLIARFFSQQ
jgi:cytochrome subunit of sulfide dehydrogenase